jgi:hypothetical protein
MAMMVGHMVTPPPALIDVAPGTPQLLSDLVLSAMAKDPSARPTAREIARALKQSGLPGEWGEEQRVDWWARHQPEFGVNVPTDQPTRIAAPQL